MIRIRELFLRELNQVELPPEGTWTARTLQRTSALGRVLLGGLAVGTLAGATVVTVAFLTPESPVGNPLPAATYGTGVERTARPYARIPLDGVGSPAVRAPQPGGASWRAPESIAVREHRLYVWDHIAGILFEFASDGSGGAALVRSIRVRDVAADAGLVEVSSAAFYLRSAAREYRLNLLSGAVEDERSRASPPSLYPRDRPGITAAPKDAPMSLGTDATGNRYQRVARPQCTFGDCIEYQRRTPGNLLVATVLRPPLGVTDLYLSESGGLYELTYELIDGRPIALVVTQLLAP